jgi:hypothetical protein
VLLVLTSRSLSLSLSLLFPSSSPISSPASRSRHEQPYARSQSVSSPASSGGTPSPRVLPFVIPHRGKTGSGSSSDKQHDGGRDSSTGRGRASPRPVRSAAAVRHRGRSTSPQVLPWRVAPEPLLQPRHDHWGPAQTRDGLLMCGSKRMALVLPRENPGCLSRTLPSISTSFGICHWQPFSPFLTSVKRHLSSSRQHWQNPRWRDMVRGRGHHSKLCARLEGKGGGDR